jgi:hypothetical protein
MCGRELAVGEDALWEPSSRTVTCLGCGGHENAVVVGEAGASALREYQRRRRRREQHARQKLGRLGALFTRVTAEPQSTSVWRQGGDGEVQVAARLAELLADHHVGLLHDRRVPRHGRTNIDHLAIGPGGVTVIDTKTHKGKIRVERVGGLLSPRRSVLRIGGREQTGLIDGVERQIELVRAALVRCGEHHVEVCGALCFPEVGGLPVFGHLSARGIAIDGSKAVAKLARRPGQLSSDDVDRIWRKLADSFPQA